LVREHQRGLWRYLRYLGARPDDAEDILQETLVTAVYQPPLGRSHAAVGGYLRRIARNVLWQRLRRKRLEPRAVDFDALDACFAAHCAEDGGEAYLTALRACLQSLDARTRAILDLQYRDGMGREAIGARHALSGDGVKSLLRRTRAALRICVERRLGTRTGGEHART
jgi:RNA polymerase sigma-70 factor (ECF subfamily)